MKFKQNFAQLMKDKGLSNYRMAQLIGVSQSSIANWLEGKTLPDASKILELTQVLNVSCDYLLTGNNPGVSTQHQTLLDAYDKADEGTRKAVDKLLDISNS